MLLYANTVNVEGELVPFFNPVITFDMFYIQPNKKAGVSKGNKGLLR